jgi:hypothetical protein
MVVREQPGEAELGEGRGSIPRIRSIRAPGHKRGTGAQW